MNSQGSSGDDAEGARSPNARLLFWLKVPYVADVALVIIGTGLLLADNSIGWWVLVFAAVRAIIGTVALFWLYPRLQARRRD
ncbi:DUF4381 domain-containing protein [Paramicrobacterium chengjingii]|uniref:Uncharacterized protein n=1 Tax=Paramicrobacterium chengjingii TaxID=2769067 RepID=A0ABX6YGV4_9MICO|nr:DUF4381 domain-containing protein [Microbacterium chengjingii]QPZ37986.1 hypothetical protein HCR76_14435 [Microbacterium chengjingii]